VYLQGCELSESDFHPVSFATAERPRRILDAFAALSILINLGCLILIMRPRLTTAASRKQAQIAGK